MNRLEEIKNNSYAITVEGQIQARLLLMDFDWLIRRIERLENALKYICDHSWVRESAASEKWLNEFVELAEKTLADEDEK